MTTEEEYLLELRTSACGFDHDEIRAEAARTALEGVAERVREMPAAAGERRRWVLEQDVLALLTPAKEDGS